MSEPVSALGNPTHGAGIAEITEIGPLGMITLRGSHDLTALRKAAASVVGGDFPERRHFVGNGDLGMAWMSPDELLLLCPYREVTDNIAKLQQALGGQHALVVNVSDARASFRVSGPHAREVMAKLAPVDLDPAAFTPGMFRRTRLAQVPVAFWMPDTETFQIICFRSVAQYVYDLLKVAAQPGSAVNRF